MKRIVNLLCCLILTSLSFLINPNLAVAAELNWVWFYSDDRYGEHISPESIKVVRDYNNNIEYIEAWTKTIYDEEGKNEVINNYGLNNTPNIYNLSFSFGKIYIKPNTRQVVWQNEIFYDNAGNMLWNKEKNQYSLDWEEVYPREYDERYFTYIIDQVFHSGKAIDFYMWKTGENRWEGLYQQNNNDGSVTRCWFDKLSMRTNGNTITYWTYVEKKRDNSIIERYYFKYLLDIKEKKCRLVGIRAKVNGDWKYHQYYDDWKSIIPGTTGDRILDILSKYVSENKIDNVD